MQHTVTNAGQTIATFPAKPTKHELATITQRLTNDGVKVNLKVTTAKTEKPDTEPTVQDPEEQ